MPVYVVRFSREAEFEILIDAENERVIVEALPKALKEIERGEWETGPGDEWSASPPSLVRSGASADHGIMDGTIVAIEDLKGRPR